MSKTLEEQLQELHDGFQKKREELIATSELLGALPEFSKVIVPRIHLHNLYGSQGSIAWEHDFYRYSRSGTDSPAQPDFQFAMELAKALPAMRLVLHKDGCISIRKAAWQETQQEKGETTPIAPFLVRVDAFQQMTAEIEWMAIVAGRCVTVKIKLPLSDRFGRFDIRWKNYMGGKRVDRCEFNPSDRLRALSDAYMHKIKWGRGSDDVPNDFTMYWTHGGEQLTPVDLLTALIA